jgi:hypothetical protein
VARPSVTAVLKTQSTRFQCRARAMVCDCRPRTSTAASPGPIWTTGRRRRALKVHRTYRPCRVPLPQSGDTGSLPPSPHGNQRKPREGNKIIRARSPVTMYVNPAAGNPWKDVLLARAGRKRFTQDASRSSIAIAPGREVTVQNRPARKGQASGMRLCESAGH